MQRILILIFVFFLIFYFPSFVFSKERSLNFQNQITAKIYIKSWIEIKNENLVRQEYDYSCGSSALATILKYFYNEDTDEEEILNWILKNKGIDNKDKEKLDKEIFMLSFYDLIVFAEQKGYKVLGLSLPLESLKKIKIPPILFVKIRKSEHFTIYKGMDDRFVYLADPSFGNTKMRREKFREIFYTRDDVKYPGKLLVLIKKENMNEQFMNIPQQSNFTYNLIKNHISPF